jgi:hypothetical protein
MTNILSDDKRQEVLALGRLGWTLRRIERATGVRRETAGAYLKAAGLAVQPPGRGATPPNRPSGVHRPRHPPGFQPAERAPRRGARPRQRVRAHRELIEARARCDAAGDLAISRRSRLPRPVRQRPTLRHHARGRGPLSAPRVT